MPGAIAVTCEKGTHRIAFRCCLALLQHRKAKVFPKPSEIFQQRFGPQNVLRVNSGAQRGCCIVAMKISVVTDDVTGGVPLAEQILSRGAIDVPADYKQRR